MKLTLCLIFLIFRFSTYAQVNPASTRNLPKDDAEIKLLLAQQEEARIKKNTARRDSIITSLAVQSSIPKGKIEDVLAVFSVAADNVKQVVNNAELTDEEKSTQLKAIAERREAALKSLLNEDQLNRMKTYILKHKIARKIE
jgi:hypothetical protein